MFTIAIISFREFLEAILIVSVFLGVSKKLRLKKELEILLAAGIGIALSFCLTIATYFFGSHAGAIFTEKNADFLESYLLIFSGFFIAYVVFSLHKTIGKNREKIMHSAHAKLEQNAFDISLFLTIIFLVVREGFEVALFSASISLFSAFIQNLLGLVIGFSAAAVIGSLTFFAYVKFPIKKVFKATEYVIILLGASLAQNGITKLLETHFNISLANMISFHLNFLPNEHSLVGNFLQSFFGVDQGFSLARLSIMVFYVGAVYVVFVKTKKKAEVKA